jgi:hypothetical protein
VDERCPQGTVVPGDRRHVLRLDAEVELLVQVRGEAIRERDRADLPGPGGPLLGGGGQPAQDAEVALDQPFDVRPLYLDDDLVTFAQAGAVHLRDRRRRQRAPVERREQPVGRLAQFTIDDREHLRRRQRLDVVLQTRQLERDRRGDQVGARRQQLAELDEDAARFLQGVAQRDAELTAVARAAKAGQRPKTVTCT